MDLLDPAHLTRTQLHLDAVGMRGRFGQYSFHDSLGQRSCTLVLLENDRYMLTWSDLVPFATFHAPPPFDPPLPSQELHDQRGRLFGILHVRHMSYAVQNHCLHLRDHIHDRLEMSGSDRFVAGAPDG